MYSVFANGIEVIKKAGVYSEESLVENRFRVNIKLTFDSQPKHIPDYEMLCDIVISSADKGFIWIEDWAETIFQTVAKQFSQCKVLLNIYKINPAFMNKFVETVGVEIEREIK